MIPPPFKKRAPVTTPVQEPKVKPPRSEVRTAVRMPGKTLTSRLIKPVGAAIAILIYTLTSAWAASTTVGAPQGAMPAAAADALISQSVAPFACAATVGGVYVDTTCAEVCVCVTADAKWARSDTGVEGTATDCCGLPPTTTTTSTTSSTTTTLPPVTIPATVGADTNCAASTPPTQDATQNAWVGYATWGQTCPTGANAAGYNVTSVSLYIGASTTGTKIKCSVYTAATPNVHVAAGCDTVEATLAANPNAYVTMATTGSCHLAASTRYWIACGTTDNGNYFGRNSTACTGCWLYQSALPYAGLWPATLTSTGSYNNTEACYLTATPGP